MRRRQFIRFVGGAVAALPLASRAQQAAMPVIGYLGIRSPAADAPFIAAFHQGLNEAGFSDGKNVTIEFRSAQNDYGRLPALAAELVQLRVNVIAAMSTPAALAAKAATATIPIVFETGTDPVNIGLVSSLNQPGGNVTGVTQMNITYPHICYALNQIMVWRRLKPWWRGCMRRRDFIKVLAGSVAAWPLAARAQQPTMPMIGFMNAASAKAYARHLSAFRRNRLRRRPKRGDRIPLGRGRKRSAASDGG